MTVIIVMSSITSYNGHARIQTDAILCVAVNHNA